MITNQQYQEWLKNDSGDAIRCVLIETSAMIGGVATPVYISNHAYRTKSTDTPANTQYLDVMSGGGKVIEKVTIDKTATLSYGEIEISNFEGELDNWLTGVWRNKDLNVYYGDYTWSRSDFKLVFSGKADQIDAKSRDKLSLPIADKLQRLNTPVSDVKLGGTSENKDRFKPILLGEASNFEPLPIDDQVADHDYMWHYGTGESLIEVRDDGVPIDENVTALSVGTFRLTQQPKGQITVSAQGDAVGGYSNTLVGLVKKLVKTYGKVADRFTDADLDLTQLAEFDATHKQSMGIYLTESEPVLSVCQKLASSIGAMVMTSRTGLLRILQIAFPLVGSPVMSIGVDDMVDSSFKPVGNTEVTAGVTLTFCRNYTPQTKIETGVVESHAEMFKLPYMTVTRDDPAVASAWGLNVIPEKEEETELLDEAEASAEALRRLGNRKEPHMTYQFEAYPQCLILERGDLVMLKFPRFGLSSGKLGVVVGVEPDYFNSSTVVQVMV